MDRLLKRMNRCSHDELELVSQHTFFSWFKCNKCQLRKMVETYPQPPPPAPEKEQYPSSEDERD